MRIDKKDIEIALKKTSKAVTDETNIYFEPTNIEHYKNKIKLVASSGNPVFEGRNFEKLKLAFRSILDDAVKSFSRLSTFDKRDTDVVKYLTVAGDY